jgi:Lar family restriction alleviation protein
MSDELKPCPFCGGKPVLLSNDLSKPFKIYCFDCEVIQCKGFNEEKYAIEAWNKRA